MRPTLVVLSALLLTACDMQSAAAPPVAPSTTPAPSPEAPTVAPSITPAPSPEAPTAAPSATSAPSPEVQAYLDDRSSAEALISSLYNAVNRREYARAYSYWRPDAPELPPYEAFVEGYNATQLVLTRYGTVSGDAGAGQARYAVPVALAARISDGTEYFVGCYTLRLSSPGAQATPPYQSLAIESATVRPSPMPPTTEELEQACAVQGSPVPPAPPADTIEASVYLDDRSEPTDVLRSFYNAVNRREYLRAYGYWDEPSLMTPLPDFIAQYDATQSVTLTTGEVLSESDTGQSYYFVPVTVVAQLADGSTQTVAGCYFLYQPDPASQMPPFQPLRISASDLESVTAEMTAAELMAERCRVRR